MNGRGDADPGVVTRNAGVGSVVTTSVRLPYSDLRADVLGLRCNDYRGSEVAIVGGGAIEVLAALAVMDDWCAAVHLLPDESLVRSLDWESFESREMPTGIPLLLRTNGLERGSTSDPARWVVYTSGTTGEPKAVTHRLASLSRMVRSSTRDLVWGLLYDPNRMAGLQVLIQAITTNQSLVAPRAGLLRERIQFLRANEVTALSATPTMWRQVMQLRLHAGWPLEQVTLGGEIADQSVLDGLGRAFQNARITHVFASTETGSAFSVSDGKAGFPATLLRNSSGDIRLRVLDNVLQVHNPLSSLADDDGFVSTGDVVEIGTDRVTFLGRSTGVVNIGGVNVWPEQVEALLRNHPEVEDALVSSTSSRMAGNLLVAQVVPTAGASGDELRRSIRRWVRDRAPNTFVPAIVDVVPELGLNSTGKAVR